MQEQKFATGDDLCLLRKKYQETTQLIVMKCEYIHPAGRGATVHFPEPLELKSDTSANWLAVKISKRRWEPWCRKWGRGRDKVEIGRMQESNRNSKI